MDPPTVKWKVGQIYACFLSHYKMEAASDARYIHDILRKMLKSPVFLDSSALGDLRKLVSEGVHKSDVLLLLATKAVLSRPWCLVEMLEARRADIPIVIVRIVNGGFAFSDAHRFMEQLEDEMRELNPQGLDLLQRQLGLDLVELKQACHAALEENANAELEFDAHAGDNVTVATMKDIVERMAEVTNRKIGWTGEGSFRRPTKSCVLKRAPSFTLEDFAHHHELDTVSTGQQTPKYGSPMRGWVRFAAGPPRFADCLSAVGLNSTTSSRNSMVNSNRNSTRASPSYTPKNRESAVFVCCSRRDAILHARVLRSELSVKIGRGCAIGGGTDTATFIQASELFIVLLSKELPTDTNAIFEIWLALQLGLPIVTVVITGAGYDFEAAATAFGSLPVALEAKQPGSTDEMHKRFPRHVELASVGRVLHASLTAIIAIAWNPMGSRNHMDAVTEDILLHIGHKRGRVMLRRMGFSSSEVTEKVAECLADEQKDRTAKTKLRFAIAQVASLQEARTTESVSEQFKRRLSSRRSSGRLTLSSGVSPNRRGSRKKSISGQNLQNQA